MKESMMPSVDDYKLEIKDITPEMAEELLRNRRGNRSLTPETVYTYAADMRAGKWYPSPSNALILDEDDHLADGQHRCAAIVESGKTIRFLVYRGVPGFVIDHAVDSGRPRSVGDKLQMNGEPRAFQKAAALRLIASITLGRYPKSSLSMLRDVLSHVGEDHVDAICEYSRAKIPAPLRAILILARPVDTEKIDRYVTTLEVRDQSPGTENAIARLTCRTKGVNALQLMRAFSKGVVHLLKGSQIENLKLASDGYADLLKLRKSSGLSITFLSPAYLTKKSSSKGGHA